MARARYSCNGDVPFSMRTTLDIPAAFVEVAVRVHAGRFTPEPLRLGMNEGIVRLVLNPRLRDRIPA